MTFLEQIFARLDHASMEPVVAEVRDGERLVSFTGGELLALTQRARAFVVARGVRKGDRAAIYSRNSVRWIALDLALMAEGVTVVPLDPRQMATETSSVLQDATPSLLFCGSDRALAAMQATGAALPKTVLFDEVFAGDAALPVSPPTHHADDDPITIIYTSGTSGEPKGVVLNAGNIAFVLSRTNDRLDKLMGPRSQPDRVFQYAPFWSAAARVLLFTSLSRNSILVLSTDLIKLIEEVRVAQPDYFVNIPLFLERVRRKAEEMIGERGGMAGVSFYSRAFSAYQKQRNNQSDLLGSLCLSLARVTLFPVIRRRLGRNIRALICGSAPLAIETQLFFMMIGIPVLQVYGLTETTAICTMDDPANPVPGRVGPAISGIEMKLGEDNEILVRGPNVFSGYWRRSEETAKALSGGWFHTGDQGEVDSTGTWRIIGRLKNLIVLNSGHKVAPEPLESSLADRLPEAQQIVVVGNFQSFLGVLIAAASASSSSNGNSTLNAAHIQSTLDALNSDLPHYKKIRAFHIVHEPFTHENGLLTTTGKLKRAAIAQRFAPEIEALYQSKPS
jgi:long-chain acyl-CoA synthetase